MDGLVRALVEVLHERRRDLEQRTLHSGSHPQLEDSIAESASAIAAIREPNVHQVTNDTVERALGDAGASGQLGQDDALVVGAEGEEDRDDLAEHRAEVHGWLVRGRPVQDHGRILLSAWLRARVSASDPAPGEGAGSPWISRSCSSARWAPPKWSACAGHQARPRPPS